MPTAADEYEHNIAFFASLAARTSSFKLQYSTTTGRFSVAGNALSRTWANRGATAADAQSVTNNAMFHDPIVAVFRAAAQNGVAVGRRRTAYQGLVKLRAQYATGEKAAKLQTTLVDVLRFVPSELEEDLKARLAAINPQNVLSDLDLAFMDDVWLRKVALFQLLDRAVQPEPRLNQGNRPFASLANEIYGIYGGHIEPEIVDMKTWVERLPMMDFGEGRIGLRLQHNNLLALAGERDQIVSNRGYGSDFIYYTTSQAIHGQALWRIYLNFDASAAGDVLTFLLARGRTRGSGIDSFKIAGPHAFHTRKDKIVVYVSASQRDALVGALQAKAADFKFKNPVPGMTIGRHPGIAIGIEPRSLDTGFSSDLDPRQSRRQSYGSIRAQLIAAALTGMHAAAEDRGPDYLDDKQTFLKWVAISFESHAAYLNPT